MNIEESVADYIEVEKEMTRRERIVRKKAAKIVLIIIAVIVYFNIGYLVAYSIDSGTTKTPTTQIVNKIIDFGNALRLNEQKNNSMKHFFVETIVFWPVVVGIS